MYIYTRIYICNNAIKRCISHITNIHAGVIPSRDAKSKLDMATMSSTRDRRGCSKVVENLGPSGMGFLKYGYP
jgi:hypothetical protein